MPAGVVALGGLVAALLAPAPAPPLREVLDRAAPFCEARSAGGTLVANGAAEMFVDATPVPDLVRPLADAPAFIRRVAETQPASRYGAIRGYARFPVQTGTVWAIWYEVPACDLIVMGADAVATVAPAFAAGRVVAGWTLAKSADGTPQAPLNQRLLIRAQPKPDAPAFGTRIKMQWLPRPEADGVQLDIEYLSGDIAPSAMPTKPQG